jgi:hypothetical protein
VVSNSVGDSVLFTVEPSPLGDEHQATLASGRLADILVAWGRLDEALAIRQEKE